MEKMRDKFWLWGHSPGPYDAKGNLRRSRMTVLEGAYYFGIKKVFLGSFNNKPSLPWDQEAMALDSMEEVGWSVIGDASTDANPETLGLLNEVLRIADKFPNTTGGYFDDFFGFGGRDKSFSLEVLGSIKDKLHAKKLKMWVGLYDRNLDDVSMVPQLNEFDCVSVWTWHGKDLINFEENIKKAKNLLKIKHLYWGIFLYNYGEKCEATAKDIEFQLNRCAELLRDGTLEGVILFSNVIADLGYEAVEYAKAWLKTHGDESV